MHRKRHQAKLVDLLTLDYYVDITSIRIWNKINFYKQILIHDQYTFTARLSHTVLSVGHIVQLQCIPVVCIQCWHQLNQKNHHTQFPTVHYNTPQPDPG